MTPRTRSAVAEEAGTGARALSGTASPPTPQQDWRDGLPILRGSGVILREPLLADAESLLELMTDAHVVRFISHPPSTRAGFEKFVSWAQNSRKSGQCLVYGIVPEGSNHVVGLIQVRQLEPGFATAEWGFAIGRPFWGTGLFSRSAQLVADFIFRDLGTHRIEARTAIQNGRGNGVLQKLGAVPEGVLRKSFAIGRQRIDQVLWSVHVEDWLKLHPDKLYTRECPVEQIPEVIPGAPPRAAAELPAWRQRLPVLTGPHVQLRELRHTDAESLVRHLSHQRVTRFILPPPSSVAGFDRFIRWMHEQRRSGQYISLGIVPEGTDHAVGLMQLHGLDPAFQAAEWGFILGEKYWGTGVFSDSARIFLDFVFETLGVRRLEARSAVANERGNGALKKMGAVHEGHLKRSFLLGGEYFDHNLWSILDEDWRRTRARNQ